jgi:hypothetical protein
MLTNAVGERLDPTRDRNNRLAILKGHRTDLLSRDHQHGTLHQKNARKDVAPDS